MTHSPDFEKLQERYGKNYITKSQLIRWVLINSRNPAKGITAAEYEEITGETYDAA